MRHKKYSSLLLSIGSRRKWSKIFNVPHNVLFGGTFYEISIDCVRLIII